MPVRPRAHPPAENRFKRSGSRRFAFGPHQPIPEMRGDWEPDPANAAIGWVLVGVLLLAAAATFVVGAPVWCLGALLVAGTITLPALAFRTWRAMIPWPLVALATVATVAAVVGFYRQRAIFAVIVALALVLVIELDSFTRVDLSARFSVVFAVMTTMALEALWIVVQAVADRWFGTSFLGSQVDLQLDIVYVTGLAIVVGLLYRAYTLRFPVGGTLTTAKGGPDDD